MNILFIGLGNMGFPMAKNLVDAGFNVTGVDYLEEALSKFKALGAKTWRASGKPPETDIIVTMLPNSTMVLGKLPKRVIICCSQLT